MLFALCINPVPRHVRGWHLTESLPSIRLGPGPQGLAVQGAASTTWAVQGPPVQVGTAHERGTGPEESQPWQPSSRTPVKIAAPLYIAKRSSWWLSFSGEGQWKQEGVEAALQGYGEILWCKQSA